MPLRPAFRFSQDRVCHGDGALQRIREDGARQQPLEEKELTVQLTRNTNGSLGFNIIGGTKIETGLSDGIIISKIVEDSPANRSLLRVHEQGHVG
ncbi:putative E3 ubiquitin-protein ligase PDZRN3-like [Apostichopus japonicus]|uniref:Putative E3 ubiquitin-protein ligase PDZRN3-like n=1 Tax=Stichopus japonicus TaxID=307972 RepID=A0A2G8LAL4_STIJA|nr:putative E3 ubiquitin-protein ligase PDZRN3-like [Apostichopus japonicus]